jgi:multimeric flavodoxin WrbA
MQLKPITRPKALILNGAETDIAFENAIADNIQSLLDKNGWSVESVVLRKLDIDFCCGRFYCWTKTPGICNKDDAARDIARSIVESRLMIYISPIVFGGYSWQLKKALDRIISLISPYFTKINGEVHHHKRYESYPDILAIGIDYNDDNLNQETFKRLVSRNAINFHCQKHASEIFLASIQPDEHTTRLQQIIGDWGL